MKQLWNSLYRSTWWQHQTDINVVSTINISYFTWRHNDHCCPSSMLFITTLLNHLQKSTELSAPEPSGSSLSWYHHPHYQSVMMFTVCLPKNSQNPTRSNRSSGLIRNSYLLNKQMIIDNSWLGLANTQDERFTPFLVIRKSLAGVNIMVVHIWEGDYYVLPRLGITGDDHANHIKNHKLLMGDVIIYTQKVCLSKKLKSQTRFRHLPTIITAYPFHQTYLYTFFQPPSPIQIYSNSWS
jgi:hypothetical protein